MTEQRLAATEKELAYLEEVNFLWKKRQDLHDLTTSRRDGRSNAFKIKEENLVPNQNCDAGPSHLCVSFSRWVLTSMWVAALSRKTIS
jgi:hypothetical protein